MKAKVTCVPGDVSGVALAKSEALWKTEGEGGVPGVALKSEDWRPQWDSNPCFRRERAMS